MLYNISTGFIKYDKLMIKQKHLINSKHLHQFIEFNLLIIPSAQAKCEQSYLFSLFAAYTLKIMFK